LNELKTVSTLLGDLLGEILNNGECSLLMVIVFVLDISRFGEGNSAVERLLLVLLGKVLDDGEHGFLVIIMVNDLHIVCFNVNEVD